MNAVQGNEFKMAQQCYGLATRYAVRGDNKEIRIKLIQDYCAHKWIQNGAAMLWAGYAVRGDNIDRLLCISRSFRRQSQSTSRDKRLYLYIICWLRGTQ